MKTLRMLFHLARADFLERIRRSGFLIVLATTVLAGYLFVPPEGAGYRVLQVGVHRGIYNSPWIGLMFGLIAALHLPLVGFYLVKNAVQRDRETGAGQIIAATPTGKLIYALGKWLSNLAVLVLILIVMTVMAVVMQLIRAEDAAVNLWGLVGPIWLMGVPVLVISAAMSVLCECVSFLRGGLGNIAFFFLWLGTLGVVMSGAVDEVTDLGELTPDPYGYTRQLVDIQAQVLADEPGAEVGTALIHTGRDIEHTFVWDGIGWTAGAILERVMWAATGIVVAMVAAIPFDRFDPARSRQRLERKGLLPRLRKRIATIWGDSRDRRSAQTDHIQVATAHHLTPLTTTPNARRFLGVLVAELKLMLRGRRLAWYAGAIGLFIACLLNPLDEARRYLVLAVLLWPMVLWSAMGNRERRNQTDQIIFSVAHPLRRQLSANWMAGFVVALITFGCVAARPIASGQWHAFIAWGAGATFVPSLALALGVWSGSPRLFEAVYILLWYLGPVEGVVVFNYVGMTDEAVAAGIPVGYLIASLLLLGIAVVGRGRHVQV